MLFETEQLILLELLKREKTIKSISFRDQIFIKSESYFSKIVNNMIEKDLLERKRYRVYRGYRFLYRLSFYGRFIALLLSKDCDTPVKYKNISNSVAYYDITD